MTGQMIDSPRRAQGLRLDDGDARQTFGRVGLKIGFDRAGQMAEAEDHPGRAEALKPSEEKAQIRPLANRRQDFRPTAEDACQPGSEAAGQHHHIDTGEAPAHTLP